MVKVVFFLKRFCRLRNYIYLCIGFKKTELLTTKLKRVMNEKTNIIKSIKKALANLNGRCELRTPVKVGIDTHEVEVSKVGYALGFIVVRGNENGRDVRYVISEDTTPTNHLNALFIALSNELLDRGFKSRVRCYCGDSFGKDKELFSKDSEDKFKAYEIFNDICQSMKSAYHVACLSGQMESEYTNRRFVVREVVGDRYYIVDIVAAL